MYTRKFDDPTDQLQLLLDALTEHNPDDPCLGDPEDWPEWTDNGTWTLTDAEDLILLRQVERTPWQDFLAGPAAHPLD